MSDCILENAAENILQCLVQLKKKFFQPQIIKNNLPATTSFTSHNNPPSTTIYRPPQILQANHNNKLTITTTTTTATPSFNQIQPITHNSKNKLTKHKSQISDLIGDYDPTASPCNDRSVGFPSRSAHFAKMARGMKKNRSALWLHVVLGKRFRLDLWVCGLVGHGSEASMTWWSFRSSPTTFFHGCSRSGAWRMGWGLELHWPLSLSWRLPMPGKVSG